MPFVRRTQYDYREWELKEKNLWSIFDNIFFVDGRLVLNQPLQDLSLVLEVTLEDNRNPVPEIDQGRKFCEAEVAGEVQVEDPDESDFEDISLTGNKVRPQT